MTRIIYKRSTTGALLEWHQEIGPEGDRFRTVAGQQDGKKVQSEWTICTPKNVGRSNETSAEDQCRLEVEANYTKKLAQGGYHERIEDVDSPKFFEPMLAQTYGKNPKKAITSIAYKSGLVWSQPKLDGMRCIGSASGLWSRYGKPILSSPHIADALQPIFERYPDLILDGELYADKLAEDFQKIMSLAKKTKNLTQKNLDDSRQYLQYHIYDLPSFEGTFSQRYAALKELFEDEINLSCQGSFFRLVPTVQVRDTAHLDELNESYIEAFLEGQMVRLDIDSYEIDKRSWQLQKRKVFQTAEFPILSITPGVGNRSKVAGRVTFQLPDGTESNASVKGSFDYAREILDEAKEYIGGDATIRFIRYTKDGKPYPAVCVAVFKGKRDY